MSEVARVDSPATAIDWRKWIALLGGLAIFLLIYFSPP